MLLFYFIKLTGLVALGTNEYFLSSHRNHVIPKLLGGFKRKAGYEISYFTFYECNSCPLLIMIKITAEHEPMECYCSVPSQIFYSWMGGLVGKGYKNPLTFEDLPKAPPQLDVGQNAKV